MRLLRVCCIVARTLHARVRVGSFALLLMLGLVALLPGSVYAADGDLDTTFIDPEVTHATPSEATVYALALQPDGKVLIGGGFTIRHYAK